MQKWVLLATIIIHASVPTKANIKILYAVNAGGLEHVDRFGVKYSTDRCRDGIASDFGKKYHIERVHHSDQILYQTERYSESWFQYDLPIEGDGEYVLVLKFSEVYFQNSGRKQFNVILNKHHRVLEDFDIFDSVGHAAAQDEPIPFKVTGNGKKIEFVNGEFSYIRDKKISLVFSKGKRDNPKINAFFLAKCSFEEIMHMLPAETDDFYDINLIEDDGEVTFSRKDIGYDYSTRNQGFEKMSSSFRRHKRRSGPRNLDPWNKRSIVLHYYPIVFSILAACISVLMVRHLLFPQEQRKSL